MGPFVLASVGLIRGPKVAWGPYGLVVVGLSVRVSQAVFIRSFAGMDAVQLWIDFASLVNRLASIFAGTNVSAALMPDGLQMVSPWCHIDIYVQIGIAPNFLD